MRRNISFNPILDQCELSYTAQIDNSDPTYYPITSYPHPGWSVLAIKVRSEADIRHLHDQFFSFETKTQKA